MFPTKLLTHSEDLVAMMNQDNDVDAVIEMTQSVWVGEIKSVRIVISAVFEPCEREILWKYSDVDHFSDKILVAGGGELGSQNPKP